MDIETLTLADERSTISREVDDLLLRDLPDGLVDGLDVVGDTRDLLNRATMGNDHVLHFIVPKLEVDELTKEPWADDLEFASEHTAGIDVAITKVS